MKRKVVGILGVAAIGAGVTFNVGMGLSNNAQNDLILANVQALARIEGDMGDFPVCRDGDGYIEPKRDYKKCEYGSCKTKNDLGGALNVNYCP